jgi:putative alpha-1,2-mannosidase
MNADERRYRNAGSFLSVSLRLGGFFLLFIIHCSLFTASAQQTRDYTRWVNPFIGTGGHGHTFPGATTPFAMVQLSPDTRGADWDGSSGYHYSDDVIYGFSHTHLSGTGIPDYCDILLMPTMGEIGEFSSTSERAQKAPWYASQFSHATEKAEPGYYSVQLERDQIKTELTSTPRVGLHRYTFSRTGKANIFVDLKWRDKLLDSKLTVIEPNRIEGYRRSSSWAKDQVVYFVAEFSRPWSEATCEIGWLNYGGLPGVALKPDNPDSYSTCDSQDNFQFDVKTGEQILVKVALSPVSIEGARKNLAAEMPGWDFDKVRADAKAAWNKELSKIDVSGGTDAQTTTFYTALYHTMIQPNIFEDVDGSYRGHDGKVHNIHDKTDPAAVSGQFDPFADPERLEAAIRARTGSVIDGDMPYMPPPGPRHEYTVFSLWDTFRAAHPLYTIIDQRRTVDFINAFIRQYEQGGRLPVWELAGNETDCMIGYHAVSVIADAMEKGIQGFNYEKAYEAAKHSAELDREGLAAYKKRGYISMEDTNESVSKTLEYAYDDWCVARMAKVMINRYEAWLLTTNKELASPLPEQQYEADRRRYTQRARYGENLFDASTGFMRPKKNGSFVSPFAPNEVTFNYTEGNAWVYTFFMPQNVERLMQLEGGPEKFAAKLDELFSTKDRLAGREQPDITGLIGQYAHGNEPSHHIAYLYDYAGQPWKTQSLVRKVMDEFYKPAPDGLIGNEDCGQMSAWYIMSALGFYQVAPGDDMYALGSPLFEKATIKLENGRTFTINAPNAPRAKYVRSVSVGGRKLDTPFIYHSSIMRGEALDFKMSPAPVTNVLNTPFRLSHRFDEDDGFVTVPVISASGRTFRGSTTISFGPSPGEDTSIHYTLDGSTPTERSPAWEYGTTIPLVKTTTVKAIAVGQPNGDGRDRSHVVEATFSKIPNDWSVKIDSKYNRQYTGGGDEGLIDSIRGTTSFASGEWQGYQGQDFVATIDLKRPTTFSEVGGGFLQNAGSWIWMPTHIEFNASSDGVNFTRVADVKTDVAVTEMRDTIRDYTAKIPPITARYLRVHAYNLGKIPSWHPGAGSDAFIFVDEIWVR